ncbi:MAG: YkgJ family cysteine cluster protein [bacterium]|nr:YkgJ family cysteine cluster protein [bacterium]
MTFIKKTALQILRLILRFIRDFDGFFTRYSKKIFKKQYIIKGQCKQCGVCCTKIAIYLSESFWHYPLLRNLAVKWYEFVYNFTMVKKEPDLKVLVFSCNYLKENKCSIHKKRPYFCRNYPDTEYFTKQVFIEGCSFYCTLSD